MYGSSNGSGTGSLTGSIGSGGEGTLISLPPTKEPGRREVGMASGGIDAVGSSLLADLSLPLGDV